MTEWFGMYPFGQTLTVGMLLLRIVDPNGESGTLPDTGFVESIQTFFELFAWSVGPYMMVGGQGLLFGGGMLLVVVVSLVVSKVFGWWYKMPIDQREAIHDGRTD